MTPKCPAKPEEAWTVSDADAAFGRLVLGGRLFDPVTGLTGIRILERTLGGEECGGTLVGASFDDGSPGAMEVTSSDPLVGWHPAPGFVPPGAAAPLRGTLYFGDPVKGNYVGSGGQVKGSLATPPFVVPGEGTTLLRMLVFFHTEDHPTYDRLLVTVECPGGGCSGTWPIVVFDNKSADASAGEWNAVAADLTWHAGLTLRIRVSFDTFDGTMNAYTGFFLDGLRVVTTCDPECWSDDLCSDSDPCTLDGCWLGRCRHIAQCQPLPLASGFEEAVVVEGQRYLPSIGWTPGAWVAKEPGAPLEGVFATLAQANTTAAPQEHPIAAPPVVVASPAEETLVFERAFAPGPGAQGSTLRLVATSLEDGKKSTLWQASALESGSPATVTVHLGALQPGPYRFEWIARVEPATEITWRVRPL